MHTKEYVATVVLRIHMHPGVRMEGESVLNTQGGKDGQRQTNLPTHPVEVNHPENAGHVISSEG